jgi:hypothetical protein
MTNDNLHEKVAALEDELTVLRGEFARLVDAALEKPGDPEVQSDDGAQALGGKLERDVEKAADAAKLVLREIDEAAKRHPTSSLFVAFGVGLLFARIFGGGRR